AASPSAQRCRPPAAPRGSIPSRCSAMSDALVAAQDLEKEYRVGPETVKVLRGVNLTVNPAESVALIGASGVGKSTLLHLLGGLDRPTAGQVLFAGEDLYATSESPLARLRPT